MENKDTRTELILEIEKMYIVSVSAGRYTGKGSFFAINEDGREFFANKDFVVKKAELIKLLSERIRPLWILVKNEIWGGKWDNLPISEIIAISENKNKCEEHKFYLLEEMKLKFDLSSLYEQHLKLFENPDWKPNDDKVKQFEREEAVLHEKLALLKVKFEDE